MTYGTQYQRSIPITNIGPVEGIYLPAINVIATVRARPTMMQRQNMNNHSRKSPWL